jgi:hypothetical protein
MTFWTSIAVAKATPLPITSVRPVPSRASMRGDHARMLAHAATRRRRATGEDRDYWKACAPSAVAKAAAIRGERGFPTLP